MGGVVSCPLTRQLGTWSKYQRCGKNQSTLAVSLIQPSLGVLRDHRQEARLNWRRKCHHVRGTRLKQPMGGLSGNALVEDDRVVRIAIHFHTGLVTILQGYLRRSVCSCCGCGLSRWGRQHVGLPPLSPSRSSTSNSKPTAGYLPGGLVELMGSAACQNLQDLATYVRNRQVAVYYSSSSPPRRRQPSSPLPSPLTVAAQNLKSSTATKCQHPSQTAASRTALSPIPTTLAG